MKDEELSWSDTQKYVQLEIIHICLEYILPKTNSKRTWK